MPLTGRDTQSVFSPCCALCSLSTAQHSLTVLWPLQGQAFDQGQLTALYSLQQHLSQQHLQLGSLTNKEQACH